MGVVIQIDFKKHATDREAARRAKEKPVNDYSTLYPPHTWPAGPDEDGDDIDAVIPDIALVMTLGGAFRDKALYAVIPREHGQYSALQFAGHVTPETLGDEKPVGRFYIPEDRLNESFTRLDMIAPAKLGQYFSKMAILSDNPGQRAQLYALDVTAVHIVTEGGLYAFDEKLPAEKYSAGDVVVQYKGGSAACGPAAQMLPRLVPLDDDARIALAAAPAHLPNAPKQNGPDGFNF